MHKAALQGLSAAEYKIGLLYEEGIGTEQSYHNADRWLKSAAEHGEPLALFELGWMRYFGIGCEASADEAKRIIDRALDKGALDMMAREAMHSDPYMQLRLGWLYDIGWGVEQSCFKALAWYSGARMMGLSAAEEFIRKLTVRLESMGAEEVLKRSEIADTTSD